VEKNARRQTQANDRKCTQNTVFDQRKRGAEWTSNCKEEKERFVEKRFENESRKSVKEDLGKWWFGDKSNKVIVALLYSDLREERERERVVRIN
jgi:hypothetical protein